MFTFFFLSHLFKDAVSTETGMINKRGAVGDMRSGRGNQNTWRKFYLP